MHDSKVPVLWESTASVGDPPRRKYPIMGVHSQCWRPTQAEVSVLWECTASAGDLPRRKYPYCENAQSVYETHPDGSTRIVGMHSQYRRPIQTEVPVLLGCTASVGDPPRRKYPYYGSAQPVQETHPNGSTRITGMYSQCRRPTQTEVPVLWECTASVGDPPKRKYPYHGNVQPVQETHPDGSTRITGMYSQCRRTTQTEVPVLWECTSSVGDPPKRKYPYYGSAHPVLETHPNGSTRITGMYSQCRRPTQTEVPVLWRCTASVGDPPRRKYPYCGDAQQV